MPGGTSKVLMCQYRRHKSCGFNPWVIKIPWRRAWQLQYSGLENSMDRGAWHATVCCFTHSRIWLKWLSMHERRDLKPFARILATEPNILGFTTSYLLIATPFQQNLSFLLADVISSPKSNNIFYLSN